MEASHVDGFDDFGKCNEFGKILSTCQLNANTVSLVYNTWRPEPCWQVWRIWQNFVKLPNECKIS